ncbi:MAG: site-specific DNA-methyltransferase [Candidatus Treponema excrementipullorum]|uniref:site-specific DNA-methyltransferase (adenine-specific) n=1 Tax=Candidatus Treponema excrementipullorum TaxID=2838768 RepID=A0A9E2NZS6_9SPIR|nr:site-specific DNA-methyltransferase [Candidatus Treponema excrementipullorum]
MDHLKMHTPNKADENFRKLAELFPNAVTETKNEQGEVVRAIDKDVLMQEINTKVVEGREERYQFTWPDKRKSILFANAPIAKTLRPCREESVNFDTTENLYIEGDNLEVLKLLQETYLGKIKMIYIDPPYNTGNDFVYEDDYSMDNAQFIMQNGGYDEQGNRLFKNMDTNGRFHTDWLNMMYPRLKLARDLLTDDGAIFISIDDNEVENLKKIACEIFGENNFIAQLVWEKKKKGAFLSKNYINMKEYVLIYTKNNNVFGGLVGEITSEESTYPCIKTTNARGVRIIRKGTPSRFRDKNYTISAGTRVSSGNMELIYLDDVIIKDSILVGDVRIDSNWIYSQEALDDYAQKGLVYITQDNYVRRIVIDERIKMLKDLLLRVGKDGKSLSQFKYELNLNNGGWGTNEDANDELHQLLGEQYVFEFSKPTRLIAKLIQAFGFKKDIIMDFFSGSATTAHAVMQLNAEDGGNRKFIMVQLPEKTDEKSEAYKAGYTNICEIGKERIRRAGAQIIHNSQCIMHNEKCLMTKCPNYESCIVNSPLDVGFRVLKCDSSNMKDVYYSPESYNGTFLNSLTENIKEDRTPEDLLFQVMLDLGIVLSSKITETLIGGKKVFDVADGFLIACFDDTVTDEVVTEIAKKKPQYFVMRDSSLAKDSVATNFDQIFALYSPYTTRKVL